MEIVYSRIPHDLKANGLAWEHVVFVPRGSDYEDELDDLFEALDAVLVDALEDEQLAPHAVLSEPDDTDDEEDE